MPTVTLVPSGLTDPQLNVSAGAYTSIDETIASADGLTLDSVTNEWSPAAGTGSAFTFDMTDLPAEADTINTVQFRVRGKVTGSAELDNALYCCDVQGTNAPTNTANWSAPSEIGDGFENKGAASAVSSSATVTEVNAWTVRVYQSGYVSAPIFKPGPGEYNLEIDCIEIIVDYNVAPPEPPSDPPSGTAYSVLPTTDTSIYGVCIARARDFVVLGGLDADRYSIRWSAIGDETDWPTPATDDARSKQSGSQSFPTKYGWVTGVAGDDFSMYIFQETAIHRASYVGGDVVWTFDTIDEDRGCVRQGRMIRVDDLIFFQSKFGYHVISGGQISNIGAGIVDDSFN